MYKPFGLRCGFIKIVNLKINIFPTSTNYTALNYNPKLEMRKHEKPLKNDRLFIQGGRGH